MSFWSPVIKKQDTKKIPGPTFPTNLSFGNANSTPMTTDHTAGQDIKGVGKLVLNTFQGMGQASMRAFGGVAGAVTGKPLTPKGTFQESLYGTDKPITLTSVGRETRFADPNKESTGFWGKFDPALGLAVGVADAVPGGTETKMGVKGLLSTLSKEKSATNIANEIRRIAPDTTPELVKNLSFKIAKEEDPAKINSWLQEAKVVPEEIPIQKAPKIEHIPETHATATPTPKQKVDQPVSDVRPSSKQDTPPAKPIPKTQLEDSTALPKTVAQKMKSVFTNVVEHVQNSEKRVLDLTGKKDMNLTSNPYEKMTLYHGKVGKKIEEGYRKAEEIAHDIVSYTGRNKTDLKEGRQEVSDYLHAQHAPERNLALGEGASGMTTEEALSITKKASPEVKAVAKKAQDLHNETLDLLKNSGVISEELYATLKTKYKNHVPLQRVMDTEDDIGAILSGRGFDVRSTGIKKAVGSDRKVADVLTNIVNNYEQAVLRSEKNIVDQATLAFVRNNADELSNVMTIRKPKSIGTDFEGKPLMEKTNDPKILQLFEDGKPVWIEFKDEKLAMAFKGVGREKLGVLLNAVGSVTRFYAGLATRFNPEFALPNKIRDLQETMTYLASQSDVGFKGALQTAKNDPSSMKAVLDGVRGANTPGAKLYNEMRSMGGTTGGMGLSTRKQTELNLDSIFDTASSRPRKAVQKLVQYVDDWNTIFEDSTRLSVYKSALANGATKERAAFLAKEASINFNRSGTGGPVINALWMFSNASIQGSTKMLRAMRNPKVASAVGATIAGSVAATSEWNDKVDPEWRNKVTKWDRLNGLPVMLPSEDGKARYFVIPISWGLKPMLVMSNSAYDATSGVEIDPVKATGDVLSSVLDAYNPIGGTDLTSAVTPTILDVPVEVARNKSWSGSLIRPNASRNEPKDIQYFKSLTETEQGRLSIEGTKKLRESTGILMSPADVNYVIDQYIGGTGRSIKKTSELLYGISTDQVPPADEFPFLSRFYRERSAEETGQGTAGQTDALKQRLSDQARERFDTNAEAEATYKQMKELPKEVASERFKVLKETNPDLAKKITEVANDEKKGLTYEDKLVKALGVDNGERSHFIYEKLEKAKSNEEKAKIWQEYKDKGLLSDKTEAQVRYLLKNGTSTTQ